MIVGHRERWGPAWQPNGQVRFQLWAPSQDTIRLHLNGSDLPMAKSLKGWHGRVADAEPGDTYGFRLADGLVVPDPASMGQASDIDSLSLVPARDAYAWQTSNWNSRPWEEAVFYEVHIGTFTQEGTFRAASKRLRQLAELGVTALEIMPIAQFSGDRGWGYDGVLQYAPQRSYGSPDDFKGLVDQAHEVGLMVFLDVVYNHFGPEGNHLLSYAPEFFRKDSTPWGAAMNFEASAVRSYFIENARYWLTEFRLDGLRFDAVDQMHDDSTNHILYDISDAIRRHVHGPRRYLIIENPANSAELIDHSSEPLFDADWNDDFHHAMHVAATGEARGHYKPFSQQPWQQVNKALATGYVLSGHALLKPPLSVPDLPPSAFIHYLQNHDQIGNRALGERLVSLVGDDAYKLWLEILILSPQIPLLFQGDDYCERRPFHFFVDTNDERAEAIGEARVREADNFGGLPEGKSVIDIPDASDPSTFFKSKLPAAAVVALVKNPFWQEIKALIALRHRRLVPLLKEVRAGTVAFERDRVIAVNWSVGAGILQMRANFSKNGVELPLRSGTPLHAREVQTWENGTARLGRLGFVLVFSP